MGKECALGGWRIGALAHSICGIFAMVRIGFCKMINSSPKPKIQNAEASKPNAPMRQNANAQNKNILLSKIVLAHWVIGALAHWVIGFSMELSVIKELGDWRISALGSWRISALGRAAHWRISVLAH